MLLTNDLTAAVVDEALEQNVDVIVCYRKLHTLITTPSTANGFELTSSQTPSFFGRSSLLRTKTRCRSTSCV